ncbi:unnamed protein product [Kuraishia capsulata CBS 1993]|uniref:Gamma-glutamyltransferase n=1 Tax=Kuraishia capsulata CBS 1993 TaxID=1382522 RepID=W6MXA4_9ASCO|nr:uncharacterized protein KUCA_T00004528001 [Kuraishia capsulata CBS 1993]CDK28545.1 unnamed protein product [Kuraishia capsulata CBS 1993]
MDFTYPSRRSVVYSAKGIVASTQPLANAAGIKVLEKGGNCVDASVAVSAVLGLIEPASTGIGGDCFGLFYSAADKKVHGINGTGRSASALSLEHIQQNAPQDITPQFRLKEDSIFQVNVPGLVAGWCDAVEKWGSGKVSMAEILAPAIDLAEEGAPVSSVSSYMWKKSESKLKSRNAGLTKEELLPILPDGGEHGPQPGTLYKNPKLARAFRLVAEHGKEGYYAGEIAEAIVHEISSRGGLVSLEDLSNHTSTFVDPIGIELLGKKLWEIPPSGSGIVALLSLGLIKELDRQGKTTLNGLKHNSVEYLHLVIETIKLAFKDSDEYVNDPAKFAAEPSFDSLLSAEYFQSRAEHYSSSSIIDNSVIRHGVPNPMFKSDTVYQTVTDKDGNAFSFINSVYRGFGSGYLVKDFGFCLQDRGGNFNCNPQSKNCIAGNKRSYHTIIPGMITSANEELYAAYGIMGGFNQPQAHVQVFLNMVLFGFDPQKALDAPRISLAAHPNHVHTDLGLGADGPASNAVTLINAEDGIDLEVVAGLEKLGHVVHVAKGNSRSLFGRGQIVKKESGFSKDEPLVWSGGSDMRGDGAAVALI